MRISDWSSDVCSSDLIVKRRGSDGIDRFVVENRPGSPNIGETDAFQADAKRVLVFSDAGGTGRSYHADLGAKNQRLRGHYLLEAGWKERKSVVEGKSVAVRVDLGGCRNIKKKRNNRKQR